MVAKTCTAKSQQFSFSTDVWTQRAEERVRGFSITCSWVWDAAEPLVGGAAVGLEAHRAILLRLLRLTSEELVVRSWVAGGLVLFLDLFINEPCY